MLIHDHLVMGVAFIVPNSFLLKLKFFFVLVNEHSGQISIMDFTALMTVSSGMCRTILGIIYNFAEQQGWLFFVQAVPFISLNMKISKFVSLI